MNSHAHKNLLCFLSSCALLGLLVCPSCDGAERRAMDLSGFLYVVYDYGAPHVEVQIWGTLYWTAPEERILTYSARVDGSHFIMWAGNRSSGSWKLEYKRFLISNVEGIEQWVQSYINLGHTFHLLVSPYNQKLSDWYDEFVYLPPDVMRIENHVGGFSGGTIGAFEFSHRQRASELMDYDDVIYDPTLQVSCSEIVSLVQDPNGEATYRLQKDARPKDSTTDVCLELSLASPGGLSINLPSGVSNELQFALPYAAWGIDFGEQPLTVQCYDPCDLSRRFPVYDIRKLIARADGIITLPDLQGSYNSGEPYAWLKVGFTQEASRDLNADGRLDLRDFAILAANWRTEDPTVADVGGAKGIGIPDGKTDAKDLQALSCDWVGLWEGFESGQFEDLGWITSGVPTWSVTSSESHSGQYCAQAGQILDGETCSMMITLDCVPGHISFWRRVSSQSGGDLLRFRINISVKAKWSGELDWEKVSFPVKEGKQTFFWDYVKDQSDSSGADSAWIDDITFTAD